MWRLGMLVRLAGRDFSAMYTWRLVAATVLPRVGFQIVFFSLIGRMIGGDDGLEFAFVGALGHSVTVAALVFAPMRFLEDKWQQTVWRLRLGILPMPVVYLARAWPYVAEALIYVTIMIVVLAPLLGLVDLVPGLLAALPLYLLLILSTLALGMAITMSSGKRAEIVALNTMTAALLVAGGVVLDPSGMPVVDALGQVLPLRHGLEAVRASLAGEAALGHAALEAAVAVGWLAVGFAVSAVQSRRARRHGIDQYA